jgi:HAD superfamily hydrolase (TIGR01549 family)
MNLSDKFKGVLADYDGTVLDSMEHLAINGVEVLKSQGVQVEVEEFICQYIQPFRKLYTHFGLKCDSPEDLDVYLNKYWEISHKNNFKSGFFPEVFEAFHRLKDSGVQLGIISAAKRDAILNRLTEEGHSDLFDAKHVVGESDSKVAAIKEFCELNKLNPDQVLMVGDVPSDIEYGKAAGVKTAGFVYQGYNESIFARLKKRLEDAEPDFIFSNWKEIV